MDYTGERLNERERHTQREGRREEQEGSMVERIDARIVKYVVLRRKYYTETIQHLSNT